MFVCVCVCVCLRSEINLKLVLFIYFCCTVFIVTLIILVVSYVCLLWLIQLLTAGISEDYTEQVNYEDSQSMGCEVLQYYLQKHSGSVFLLVQRV